MAEAAKNDEPADPAVGALAASWAVIVTTEGFEQVWQYQEHRYYCWKMKPAQVHIP